MITAFTTQQILPPFMEYEIPMLLDFLSADVTPEAVDGGGEGYHYERKILYCFLHVLA